MHALLLLAIAAAPLTTVAEQSGWTKTGRIDEVERLCAEFPRRYPGKVKCERFGTTPMGRPMLALIASSDGTFTPEAARAKKRPVVLFQGGIHAGEIDGKDAGFWLLREVLDGRVAVGTLSKVTLVFVPVFNVDGHERYGPNNRVNQRGPEEMGFRVTAQNLNLNRDYMKADAPEMRAMLGLLHRFDPILYADLHVTDGAQFQHDVSIIVEPRRGGSQALRPLGEALSTSIRTQMEAKQHHPLEFYASFLDENDPSTGISQTWAPPRFSTTYWASNHRLGVLVETHSWKTYPERVKSTFDACAIFLEEAAAHGTEWVAAAQRLDAQKIVGTEIPLSFTLAKAGRAFDFLGYAYTRTSSDVSGKQWIRYDESKPQVWKIEVRDVLEPAQLTRPPRSGYVVDVTTAPLLAERLAAHGLTFTTVTKTIAGVTGQEFRGEATMGARSNEGRQSAKIAGAWSDATFEVPKGSLFVPIDQPHGDLVMQLLEPTAADSFAAWGFFNVNFEQKEYVEDYLLEPFAREQLKNPAVKKAFDEKLKDPAFAKDGAARLHFFELLHPAFDARFGLLPIRRVDSPLNQ